ncbi:hypothetical protein QP095_10825, partial [Aerococcus urinae]|nr:hypothetical protein [Aerococcus urinae]
ESELPQPLNASALTAATRAIFESFFMVNIPLFFTMLVVMTYRCTPFADSAAPGASRWCVTRPAVP